MRKSGNILLSLVAAAVAAGCSGGQGDVNRVQPNYYPKSQFQGEWYTRDTVIDVPYENAMLFEGLATGMEKIRWEIQENALIAYRTTEHVIGADGHSDTGKPEFETVAAWAISSHFDIVREYNPATGEQTNVLSENSSDRPWWEREYIRVDWSRNIVSNYAALQPIMAEISNGSGADYWVQAFEEDNPDRVEVEKDYIGVVGKYNVLADPYACYMFVEFFFQNGDTSACLPTNIKVRSSFVKVDPNRPRMQPLPYPDRERLAADLDGDHEIEKDEQLSSVLRICTSANPDGSCTVVDNVPQVTYVECTQEVIDALNQDPFYSRYQYTKSDCGEYEQARASYFEKFGFFRTERPAYDRDYGHSEKNRVLLANRWNIWESNYDKDGMPIPYAQRKPRTVVYYLNPDFPENLYPEAFEIGRQFNLAFVETVAGLQGKEVGKPGYDPMQDPAYANMKVFEVRPNACSPDNVRKFVKDKGLEDVAGRVIGSMANLDFSNLERVCAALEQNSSFRWQKNGDLRYSFVYWVDRPQLAGPLGFGPSYADPETGEIINGTAYVYGAGVDKYAAFATDIVQVMRGEQALDDVISGDNIRAIVAFGQKRDAANRESLAAQREDLRRRLQEFELRGNGQPGLPDLGPSGNPGAKSKEEIFADLRQAAGSRLVEVPHGFAESRLSLLRQDPELERALVDTEGLMLAGWRPGDDITDELVRKASPIGLMEREKLRKAYEDRFAGKNCVMLESFTDPSVIGLAMQYDAGNKTRQEIYDDLRKEIFLGVTLHEVGHTVGLRHNFSGSYDALNYFDRFWEIRANYPDDINQAVGLASGEDKVALQACIERAEDWKIDPPTASDCLRGPEFKISSIMDYGARFNSDFGGLGKYDHAAIRFGYGELVDVFADEVGVPADEVDYNLFIKNYKEIPDWLGGPQNIKNRRVRSYAGLVKDRMQQIRSRSTPDALPRLNAATGACEANCENFDLGAVEVPYKFCSDEYASYEDMDCKRWDEGASQEEIVDSAIKRYETYYPFNAFRRGRVNWNPNAWLSDLGGRTLNHFIRTYQFYLYFGRYYERLPVGDDLAQAAINGLNMMGEILQQPEDGWYCKYDGKFYNERNLQGCNAQTQGDKFYMPLGVGKPHWSRFSNSYHFNFDSIGAAYDKRITLSALTVNSAYFFGVDNLDVRRFSLSYYQLYRPEMIDLMRGIMTGDFEKYAGYVVKEDNELVYKPRRIFDPNALSSGGGDNVGVLAPAIANDYGMTLDTAVYGTLYLSSPYDGALDFNNYMKASVKGSWDDVDWGNIDRNDPNIYVEMTDPITRKTYTAVNSVDGLSITHQLLTRAKDYLDRYWQPAKDRLEAADPGSEEYRKAKADMEGYEQDFRFQLETLDWARRLNRLIEFGT